MDKRFLIDPWKVVETAFAPDDQRFSESLMSLGNGYMGLRGNFEEGFSGDTHRGTYIGGVWFPDKTRVGWWKIGYPAYFGKVINAMNLIGCEILVDGVRLDAAILETRDFYRELDMRRGVLMRRLTYQTQKGSVLVEAERFVSMAEKTLLGVRLRVTPDFEAEVAVEAFLDGNVRNEDSNYDEIFWEQLDAQTNPEKQGGSLTIRTKENPFGTPRFTVCAAFTANSSMTPDAYETRAGYAMARVKQRLAPGQTAALDKLVHVVTDRDYKEGELSDTAWRLAEKSQSKGYDALVHEHIDAWARKWDMADVAIKGDDAAQQGIRFNLFHLLCTYTGEDARLNIGPKGFTGEKYGGATYWDTEAYCFPVYLSVMGEMVALQLLRYRFLQLPGAYHNASRQGLPGALYPMVTFDGIECHNEWEITFMEIHRNGAVAHAIFNYYRYTGDVSYLTHEGLSVLCGIARFWAGRVHFNEEKQCYMIHGVTGPNEYENNVNNNWYTNRVAAWCLDFFREALELAPWERLVELSVTGEEIALMADISGRMYYPQDAARGVFVQHDTFMDKDLMPASSIPPFERPINQHWSWDRILRSPFIKQADVLQGLYFLGHLYDRETKQRNFDFYEPMTVHESSLSPCVHAIIAAEIGNAGKAIEMYHKTARLDLDNLNNDTNDGLHVTSMAGSWLAIVQGFAGMRTVDGLRFDPFLPAEWEGYAFRFNYRGRLIDFSVSLNGVVLSLLAGDPLRLFIGERPYLLEHELKIGKETA